MRIEWHNELIDGNHETYLKLFKHCKVYIDGEHNDLTTWADSGTGEYELEAEQPNGHWDYQTFKGNVEIWIDRR